MAWWHQRDHRVEEVRALGTSQMRERSQCLPPTTTLPGFCSSTTTSGDEIDAHRAGCSADGGCSPRLYGGTERVVHWLTEELVALGNDVTLFASGDS